MRRALASAVLLAAGACHRPTAPASQDIAPNDPAIASALADPIMSDPQLTDASGAHLARTAATPEGAPVPLDLPGAPDPAGLFDRRLEPTLGLVAGRALGLRPGCGQIGYSATWAARLPAFASLPSDAAVIEAAGEDRPGCAIRVVRFASVLTPPALVARMSAKVGQFGLVAHHANGAGTTLTAVAPGTLVSLGLEPARSGTRATLVTYRAR